MGGWGWLPLGLAGTHGGWLGGSGEVTQRQRNTQRGGKRQKLAEREMEMEQGRETVRQKQTKKVPENQRRDLTGTMRQALQSHLLLTPPPPPDTALSRPDFHTGDVCPHFPYFALLRR